MDGPPPPALLPQMDYPSPWLQALVPSHFAAARSCSPSRGESDCRASAGKGPSRGYLHSTAACSSSVPLSRCERALPCCSEPCTALHKWAVHTLLRWVHCPGAWYMAVVRLSRRGRAPHGGQEA